LRRTSSALIVSLRSVSLRPRTGVPEQTRTLHWASALPLQ
jgi:hypothetical protein